MQKVAVLCMNDESIIMYNKEEWHVIGNNVHQ
jgi:hypothetical protein